MRYFTTNNPIISVLKLSVAYVMLPLFQLIDINSSLELQLVFLLVIPMIENLISLFSLILFMFLIPEM